MQYFFFASTYGSGAYSQGTYDSAATVSPSPSASPSPAPTAGVGQPTATPAARIEGTLADTGVGILLAVTLASTLIFAALIVRFWKRPTRAPQPPTDRTS